MKSSKGETITFVKRYTGVVESVIDRNTPNEKYFVILPDRTSAIIYPKDIVDSGIALRKKSHSRKKPCGCA